MFNLENLSKVLRACLMATFVVGSLVTIFLSVIMKRYFGWYFWDNPGYYRACLILLTPSGLSSLGILWQLISLLKTIHQKNPFVRKNVVCLKRIALCSFVIAIMFFVLLFFQATALTFAIAYIFTIAGFSCVILAGLFQRAVEYKDENDLTI